MKKSKKPVKKKAKRKAIRQWKKCQCKGCAVLRKRMHAAVRAATGNKTKPWDPSWVQLAAMHPCLTPDDEVHRA